MTHMYIYQHTDSKQTYYLSQLKMAPKQTSTKKSRKKVQTPKSEKHAGKKQYEIIVLCCHECKQATEIVGNNDNGELTFREYYCATCAGTLAVVNFLVKP